MIIPYNSFFDMNQRGRFEHCEKLVLKKGVNDHFDPYADTICWIFGAK